MNTPKPKNMDEYIGGFPAEVQEILEKVRLTIRLAAPGAEEKISYSMPAFALNGILVYFAAYKHHIGLYGFPTTNDAFAKELSGYKTGRGSVQFPLDEPMPLDLIRRIVLFRAEENLKKKRKS
ncbi:iron chaperone [Flavobacterium humi]|uniref:YdhG-like domain-containing protein n=1 Tax=Flavobacterium humi TaxID=2562683 RepID=A0A4Z0L6Z4_9FLAO|nr:DUF1801 domain-containing protein [Flavobacterium humi]TGD56934.1 hypothetical protein E4635_14160 [Flavobacterium humi]